jgi:hypothetical protein
MRAPRRAARCCPPGSCPSARWWLTMPTSWVSARRRLRRPARAARVARTPSRGLYESSTPMRTTAGFQRRGPVAARPARECTPSPTAITSRTAQQRLRALRYVRAASPCSAPRATVPTRAPAPQGCRTALQLFIVKPTRGCEGRRRCDGCVAGQSSSSSHPCHPAVASTPPSSPLC